MEEGEDSTTMDEFNDQQSFTYLLVEQLLYQKLLSIFSPSLLNLIELEFGAHTIEKSKAILENEIYTYL